MKYFTLKPLITFYLKLNGLVNRHGNVQSAILGDNHNPSHGGECALRHHHSESSQERARGQRGDLL